MSSVRVFDPTVFNSYTNLQNFLLSSDAINQVLSRKDKPFSKVLRPLNPNLSCKWQVCQIATSPFRWIAAVVLKIIAKIASFLGAAQYAKQAKTGSHYLSAGFDLYSETPTKLFKIKNTTNGPNTQGKIVNETSLIPESHITDSRVKNRTFCRIYNGVKFNHHHGICRGMSNWFLYLYLKTKDQFSDPQSHMAAIGRQFAEGGGMESTLLQSIYLRKGNLLNMKVGTQVAHSPGTFVTSLYKYTPSEWKSSTELIVCQLQNMPAGAYEVGLPLHDVTYVKINNRLGFFFDPNHGITEINGDAVGENLYELISKTLRNTGEFSKEHKDLILHVDIIPVSLRN